MSRLTPAGLRLLEAASELFYSRGITAVGVELIADRAGTTKKTLYDRFGSKEGLVVAYLEHRNELWQSFLDDWLACSTTTGVERVLEPFHALAAWLEEHVRGCGFANAHAELAGSGHAGLAVIVTEKRLLAERYAALAADAGLPDAERLGLQLTVLHDGAIVHSSAGRRPDAVDAAVEVARVLISR